MDYSIKGYLSRLSTEDLKLILKNLKGCNDEYEYIIECIYEILYERQNLL